MIRYRALRTRFVRSALAGQLSLVLTVVIREAGVNHRGLLFVATICIAARMSDAQRVGLQRSIETPHVPCNPL